MLKVERVRALLHYDPETGVFTRKVRTSNRINIGDVAGGKDAKGYICIRVDGKTYKAHRLAWLYMHGAWPTGEIDHINGVRDDNRITNLRNVTKSQNQQNQRSVRGYSRDGKRWKSQIRVGGEFFHLGCFATQKEAHAAYLKAKQALHIQARES